MKLQTKTILLLCSECNSRKRIPFDCNTMPLKTEKIVCNYCPNCGDDKMSDFWEEEFYDKFDDLIIYEKINVY